MIMEYNRKSYYFGVPGIILQTSGRIMTVNIQEQANLGAFYMLVGTALLITGFVFYTKAKSRAPAWCLFAFLSIIGVIVLACLKDKSVTETTERKMEL